jgi:uncharacterized protein (DUF2267 family)
MDVEEFLALVGRFGGMARDEAERATGAVLTTLAERLSAGEARQVAAQLPAEFLALLHTTTDAEGFDVDEFLRRVAAREGVDVPAAERHARAVFVALRRALAPDEWDDVVAELPDDFGSLLSDVPPMPAEEFVARVARRAKLDTAEAQRVTDLVLEALALRLPAGEIDDLLGRLPASLHPPLQWGKAHADGTTRRMPLASFVLRIAQRQGVTPDEALASARAVLATLREAVEDEFNDVRVELPPEYHELLPADAAR